MKRLNYPHMRPMKMPHMRKRYYYIVAIVKGRPYFDGKFNTRAEAEKMAWQKLQGVVWDIEESDIGDLARFTQQGKHRILEDTGDIEIAVQRAKHQI